MERYGYGCFCTHRSGTKGHSDKAESIMRDKKQNSWEHGAATIPQLGERCLRELRDAGFDQSLVDDLLDSITEASYLVDRVPDSIRVTFPATQSAPEPLTPEFVIAHWKDVAGRLQLARLSADRALRDLLEGFVVALQTCNTAVACLCARASIENAAAYDSLSRCFMGRSEKIEATILPYLKEMAASADLSTLYDQPLVKDLVRFQHGAKLWPIGDCPTTVAEWKTWRKHSLSKKEEDGKEQSIAGQILDALSANQRNVLTSLDKLAKRKSHMWILGLYDMLSEFCHPNADNRSLGVEESRVNEATAIVDFVGKRSWTRGAIKGASLSMFGIVEAIDIHVAAHNSIHDSTHELCVHLALS